jgi:DNA polymerase III epsilon subunit-like protein
MNPRILFLDTENAPNIAAVWGIHDQRVSYTDIVREWFFISAQWQWLDSKKVCCVSVLDDRKAFKKDFTNDLVVVKTCHALLSDAEIVVGHNIKGHDMKKLQAKFIEYKMKPLNMPIMVDTLEWSRKFGFTSRRLADLCSKLGLEKKLMHEPGLFLKAALGDEAAIKKVVTYGLGDIPTLKQLYERLKPYSNHPNLNIWRGTGVDCCPNCSSTEFHASGYRYTKVGRVPRNECLECGKWFDAGKHDKRVRMR